MSKIKLAVHTTKYKDKALQFKKEFLDNNENVISDNVILEEFTKEKIVEKRLLPYISYCKIQL